MIRPTRHLLAIAALLACGEASAQQIIQQPLPPPPGVSQPQPLPGQQQQRQIQSQPLPPPPGVSPPPGQPGQPAQGQQRRPGAAIPPAPSTRQQQEAPPPAVTEPNRAAEPERIPNPTTVFAGLDKVTGRIVSFDVQINETVQFGALRITPRVCYTRPPTEQPETIAFVEIDEITLQRESRRIFAGWMFAASPGLNAVEHPIYDVWVTDCKGGERREAPQAPKLGE